MFNKEVLYKDLLQQYEKKENYDNVVLDDTPKDDVPVVPHDLQQQIPHTPMNFRWSTRLSRPPEIFSSSFYSIL